MPVHPYYRTPSNSSTTRGTSSSTHPQEIHHFTRCPHKSPPANRPLNIQPQSSNDPTACKPKSTISGRCPTCDENFRRDAETEICRRILDQVLRLERQYGIDDVDHKDLDGQVMALYDQRKREVKEVWRGYERRWGIGCLEHDWDGRMILGWIRPGRYGGVMKL